MKIDVDNLRTTSFIVSSVSSRDVSHKKYFPTILKHFLQWVLGVSICSSLLLRKQSSETIEIYSTTEFIERRNLFTFLLLKTLARSSIGRFSLSFLSMVEVKWPIFKKVFFDLVNYSNQTLRSAVFDCIESSSYLIRNYHL